MSRKGKPIAQAPKTESDLQKTLEEVKKATREVHEILQAVKEERRGLQQDKRSLELTREFLAAAVKEAKDMIDHEIATVMAAAIQGTITAANEELQRSTHEMHNAVEEFRTAKDNIIRKANEEIESDLSVLKDLAKKLPNGKVEFVVAGEDDSSITVVPSTFGNKG